jgi:hypothetical protein
MGSPCSTHDARVGSRAAPPHVGAVRKTDRTASRPRRSSGTAGSVGPHPLAGTCAVRAVVGHRSTLLSPRQRWARWEDGEGRPGGCRGYRRARERGGNDERGWRRDLLRRRGGAQGVAMTRAAPEQRVSAANERGVIAERFTALAQTSVAEAAPGDAQTPLAKQRAARGETVKPISVSFGIDKPKLDVVAVVGNHRVRIYIHSCAGWK